MYQGLYNALSRGVEADLMPVLRDNDMSFYAYNPLAGGLLTGKHSGLASLTSTDGRFKDNAFYFDRYGKEELFEALAAVSAVCEAQGVSMADASLRWMTHHSILEYGSGDKVVLGCSSVEQLRENLASCLDHGSLSPELVAAFESAWAVAQ